jgi:hypothetical protein
MSMDEPGLVYSTHVYPGKGSRWHEAFGHLADSAPVFAGEWGGSEGNLEWGRRLVAYLDRLQMGWTAWSWHDSPLVVDRSAPTPFGQIVRTSLAMNFFLDKPRFL